MAVSRRGRRAAPRRKLVWARDTQSLAISTTAAGAASIPAQVNLLAGFESSYGAQLIGCTVMRMRGAIIMAPANNAGTTIRGVAGVRIGDQQDLVGVGVDDNILSAGGTEANLDWMLYEPFVAIAEVSPNRTDGSQTVTRLIDVKSMRKLEELNQTLLFNFSTLSNLGGATTIVNVTTILSILLALP